MGYRHYFYRIDKDISRNIRDKSWDELTHLYGEPDEEAEDESKAPLLFKFDDVPSQKELYCFGKIYYDNTIQRLEATGEPFFKDSNVQSKLNEEYDINPYLMNKKSIEEAIKIHKEWIREECKEILDQVEKDPKYSFVASSDPEKIPHDIAVKCFTKFEMDAWLWQQDIMLNLEDNSTEAVCNGFNPRYRIFDLAFIYKHFDFDKYDLLFYGW